MNGNVAMGDADSNIAVLASELRTHLVADDKAQTRTENSMSEIKAMIADLSKIMRESTQRLHIRIDDAETTARQDTQSAITIARGEVKVAMDLATDASQAVLGTKIWVLGGAVTGLLGLIGAATSYIKAH